MLELAREKAVAAVETCLNNIAVSLHRQTLCSVSLALRHADGVA
jgi:hypothetical protein